MRPRRYLITGAAACALLIATACSTGPARSSVPAPADWTPETAPDPLSDATTLTSPSVEFVLPPEAAPTDGHPAELAPADKSPAAEARDGRGLIASAGPTGLRLLAPSGEIVGELGPGYLVTQPTWSRDGRRLVATLTHPTGGDSQVAVVDIATGDIATSTARRPYFFYSWNHDGSRLAALGPGTQGGTAMDILDDTGTPTSASMVQSGSIFVAWEPDGRRLLLHAGPQLWLINDPDTLEDHAELGVVGFGFQAAAWVPGTEDFLYVDDYQQPLGDEPAEAPSQTDDPEATPRLVRRSLDRGEDADLGPAEGLAAMAVHPDGDRVALAFVEVQPTEPADLAGTPDTALVSEPADPLAGAVPQSSGWRGSVEILDLATSERLTVLEGPGLWLEWSPDGHRLLMATTASIDGGATSLAWHVWDGIESDELTRFAPSVAFLSNYLPFADQYDETPRLWSPDGDAITFGASTADGDITVVARLDRAGAVASLGPSDVSFWSPVP